MLIRRSFIIKISVSNNNFEVHFKVNRRKESDFMLKVNSDFFYYAILLIFMAWRLWNAFTLYYNSAILNHQYDSNSTYGSFIKKAFKTVFELQTNFTKLNINNWSFNSKKSEGVASEEFYWVFECALKSELIWTYNSWSMN